MVIFAMSCVMDIYRMDSMQQAPCCYRVRNGSGAWGHEEAYGNKLKT